MTYDIKRSGYVIVKSMLATSVTNHSKQTFIQNILSINSNISIHIDHVKVYETNNPNQFQGPALDGF